METYQIDKLINKLFETFDSVRYVAVYHNAKLTSKQRTELSNASHSESDKYEELFVNPTLLKMAGQRGKLDCGGLNFIVIRYGNFFQLIREFGDGHISICIDKEVNPIDLEPQIKSVLADFFPKSLV